LQNHKISWDSTPKQILKKTKYYDENIEKNKNMYNIVKLYYLGVPGPSCSTSGPLKRCMTVCLRYCIFIKKAICKF
jgi:hypothetical protein